MNGNADRIGICGKNGSMRVFILTLTREKKERNKVVCLVTNPQSFSYFQTFYTNFYIRLRMCRDSGGP